MDHLLPEGRPLDERLIEAAEESWAQMFAAQDAVVHLVVTALLPSNEFGVGATDEPDKVTEHDEALLLSVCEALERVSTLLETRFGLAVGSDHERSGSELE
jgi:hypothetical protein